MNFKYIDIHSHTNFPEFSEDRENVIKTAHKNGVQIINVGTNRQTSIEVVRLANQYEKGVYAIVGLHPAYVNEEDFSEKDYEDLISDKKVVAIGECGLDYSRLEGDIKGQKEKQIRIFRQQIEFAIKHDKPIMIHCRDAYEEVLEILQEYKKSPEAGPEGQKLRGNAHFFVGSLDVAQRFISLGFTVSFTGVITFAPQYESVVRSVPLNMMHAETDAPYVAPSKFRGKRNEATYFLEVVKKIAEIKEELVEDIAEQLAENAKKLFGIEF
jgi:TatD DNase family protein